MSQRIAILHDAGYVHGNLKPSKVLFMAANRRWTVSGYSRAAVAGAEAPLHFTLAYAAPEAASAFVSGWKCMACTPALDAWALGVMAFELLTGEMAFNLVTDGQATVSSPDGPGRAPKNTSTCGDHVSWHVAAVHGTSAQSLRLSTNYCIWHNSAQVKQTLLAACQWCGQRLD